MNCQTERSGKARLIEAAHRVSNCLLIAMLFLIGQKWASMPTPTGWSQDW